MNEFSGYRPQYVDQKHILNIENCFPQLLTTNAMQLKFDPQKRKYLKLFESFYSIVFKTTAFIVTTFVSSPQIESWCQRCDSIKKMLYYILK